MEESSTIPSKLTTTGLIHYYYGPGNGKTSIALGHILRAVGRNFRVIMIQFLKKHDPTGQNGFYYGEYRTLTEKLGVPVRQYGEFHFIYNKSQITEELRTRNQKGFQEIAEILKSDQYDLVILDELVSALKLELFDLQRMVKLLKNKNSTTEVIITGREFFQEIEELADYSVYLQEKKHPFQNGINARPGIEY